MNFTINIERKNKKNISLKFEDNAYQPVTSLFSVTPNENYALLLKQALEDDGYDYNGAGFDFAEPGDHIPEGSLEIYDPVSEVILSKLDFLKITKSSLYALLEKSADHAPWITDIKLLLPQLDQTIEDLQSNSSSYES